MNTPAISIYHANARNTGAAIRIAFVKPRHIEVRDEFSDGHLDLTIASQSEAGEPPSFDWDNSIDMPLYFAEISMILEVLHGVRESINDGKGIWMHRTNGERIILRFRHIIEPLSGYALEVFRRRGNDDLGAIHILLSEAEAMGIGYALEATIGKMLFGD